MKITEGRAVSAVGQQPHVDGGIESMEQEVIRIVSAIPMIRSPSAAPAAAMISLAIRAKITA